MVVPSVINVVFSSLVFPASVMLAVDSDATYFDCVSSVVVDTDIVPDSIVVVSDPFVGFGFAGGGGGGRRERYSLLG